MVNSTLCLKQCRNVYNFWWRHTCRSCSTRICSRFSIGKSFYCVMPCVSVLPNVPSSRRTSANHHPTQRVTLCWVHSPCRNGESPGRKMTDPFGAPRRVTCPGFFGALALRLHPCRTGYKCISTIILQCILAVAAFGGNIVFLHDIRRHY